MNNPISPNTAPLATWMKLRLLGGAWPFVALLLALIFTVFILPSIVGTVPIALPLFLAFACLVLGFQAVQRLRDFLSGVAVVETDVLERSWRGSGQGRMFFAHFERLGRMRIMPKAHFQSHNGARYRVTYSPISKIVWALEKVS